MHINSPVGWGSVSAHGALGVRLLGTIVGIGQSPATEEANNLLFNVEFSSLCGRAITSMGIMMNSSLAGLSESIVFFFDDSVVEFFKQRFWFFQRRTWFQIAWSPATC